MDDEIGIKLRPVDEESNKTDWAEVVREYIAIQVVNGNMSEEELDDLRLSVIEELIATTITELSDLWAYRSKCLSDYRLGFYGDELNGKK